MKTTSLFLASLLMGLGAAESSADTSLLFIGNSFTFGSGSATKYYRADSVTDLNNQGIGGVPALFKSFADQAGLDFDVALETQPGSGLDYHLENKLGVIGRRPWDVVVMHGYSTLDRDKPGNPETLVTTAAQMSDFLRQRNPDVQIYMTATWSRADQTYPADRPWFGKPISQMGIDVRAGYDKAVAGANLKSVNPVGDAWNLAMANGIADSNPYDGIEAGKLNLWTYDHYHASDFGYYLEALVVFGNVTGLDPRSLGDNECSGYELGMSSAQVKALQQVAFDQLAKENKVKPTPLVLPKSMSSERCAPVR
jgi:hypothetical protein